MMPESSCPVYVLCGPTGVGKSQLAIELADKYKGEVVSADSRQIYLGMDIGTGKVPPEARNVRHHLLDVIGPQENFSAQDFRMRALEVLKELKSKGGKAFVVGGTGLYLKALTQGLFPGSGRVAGIRENLEKMSTAELYQELKQLDLQKAGKLSANDRQRIVRALEVFYAEGKPMSAIEKKRRAPAGFKFIWAGLSLDRKKLYERIEARIDSQLKMGWLEEVVRLKKEGFCPEWPGFKTIGYPEIYRFLQGELTQAQMAQTIKQKTRNYAKRQMTWFRHQTPVCWFDADDRQIAGKLENYWGLN